MTPNCAWYTLQKKYNIYIYKLLQHCEVHGLFQQNNIHCNVMQLIAKWEWQYIPYRKHSLNIWLQPPEN